MGSKEIKLGLFYIFKHVGIFFLQNTSYSGEFIIFLGEKCQPSGNAIPNTLTYTPSHNLFSQGHEINIIKYFYFKNGEMDLFIVGTIQVKLF